MARRCFPPGETVAICLRCPLNTYIFKPGYELNGLILPLIVNAMKQFGVAIHAVAIVPDRIRLLATPMYSESNLSGAMHLLNSHLDTYVRITIGRDTPIFRRKSYEATPITSAEQALIEHAAIVTAPQNYGFSESNDMFGAGVTGVEEIGRVDDSQIYDRPMCVGADAKFQADFESEDEFGQVREHIFLRFPLMPVLEELEVETVREAVAKLVETAREGIEQFRSDAAAGEYPEEACNDLDEPPAPRPSNEYETGRLYRADFPYEAILEVEAQNRLDEARTAHLEWKNAWNRSYDFALERWCNGQRDVAFPLGTQKMRFLHNCPVMPLQL